MGQPKVAPAPVTPTITDAQAQDVQRRNLRRASLLRDQTLFGGKAILGNAPAKTQSSAPATPQKPSILGGSLRAN